MAKWQRKFILLFKSEKRLGANQLIDSYAQHNVEAMKTRLIQANSTSILDTIIQANPHLVAEDTSPAPHDDTQYEPKRIRDLYTHLTHLQQEFIGQPELHYYHAVLIVLLRRRFQPVKTYQTFCDLWQQQRDYLSQNLTLRWIVSACDTFIDYDPNPTKKAIFLNIITLINTLKVYETQLDLLTDNRTPSPNKIQSHRQSHLPLYDDLRYFRPFTDDTLKHMRQRYQSFAHYDAFATNLLLAVFDRLQSLPTAFSTLKQLHTNEASKWW